MLAIKVKITRFVDDHQPGWVECSFVDAHGRTHLFIEKAPVVSLEHLDASSSYPTDGVIGCIVVKGSDSMQGMVTVSTEEPWYIESDEGLLLFDVWNDQLTEMPDPIVESNY